MRDRMIIFGGDDGLVGRNDVWALSLTGTPTWSALNPTGPLPVPRVLHSAIYDPVRDRMLVFGGFDDVFGLLDDVWALDLSGPPVWSQLAPKGAPAPARAYHTAIYDPIRDRMITFGGLDSDYSNATWALSLAGPPEWAELGPIGVPPSGRLAPAAIYDPIEDRLVMFGGMDLEGSPEDAWELRLSSVPEWHELAPAGPSPPGRFLHTAVHDSARDRMLVFGGDDLNDVWALELVDSLAWIELQPASPLPPGREAHSAVYDPAGDQMVVFGGTGLGQLSDVWTLALGDPPAWSSVDPIGLNPLKLAYHSAILDANRGQMVVFGGLSLTNGMRSEAWSLDLTGPPEWSEILPPGARPARRLGHSAIFDSPRDRMIVFGGATQDVTLNDLWTLSLGENPVWTPLVAAGIPPAARGLHVAIYDAPRDRMIVFGGIGASGYRNDVWALNLVGPPVWTMLAVAGVPPSGREGSTAVFDVARNRMVVFGGFDGSVRSDTWALQLSGLSEWIALHPAGEPPHAREGHAAVYDPVRDRLVVFGGEDGLNAYADVWALDFAEPATWDELQPTGMLPPPRYGHSAILGSHGDQMVSFGGNQRSDLFRLSWTSSVAVDPPDRLAASRLELSPLFPNPSQAGLRIAFALPQSNPVSITVHDSRGRIVHKGDRASLDAGHHDYFWDGLNALGDAVESGIYFVSVRAGGERVTRKAILVR